MSALDQPMISPRYSWTPRLRPSPRRWSAVHVAILFGFWLAIYATSLRSPALLDDADATHAQAAGIEEVNSALISLGFSS